MYNFAVLSTYGSAHHWPIFVFILVSSVRWFDKLSELYEISSWDPNLPFGYHQASAFPSTSWTLIRVHSTSLHSTLVGVHSTPLNPILAGAHSIIFNPGTSLNTTLVGAQNSTLTTTQSACLNLSMIYICVVLNSYPGRECLFQAMLCEGEVL